MDHNERVMYIGHGERGTSIIDRPQWKRASVLHRHNAYSTVDRRVSVVHQRNTNLGLQYYRWFVVKDGCNTALYDNSNIKSTNSVFRSTGSSVLQYSRWTPMKEGFSIVYMTQAGVAVSFDRSPEQQNWRLVVRWLFSFHTKTCNKFGNRYTYGVRNTRSCAHMHACCEHIVQPR